MESQNQNTGETMKPVDGKQVGEVFQPKEFQWSEKDWEDWQAKWQELFKMLLRMPPCRQTALAKTKMEEALMWAWNFHSQIEAEPTPEKKN